MENHIPHKSRTHKLALIAATLVVMLLCLLVLPVSAYAKSDEPKDDGGETQPATVIDDEEVTPATTTPNSATPPSTAQGSTTDTVPDGTGNVTDNSKGAEDPTASGKQFVNVETKSGKIFYLVIDHDKTSDNVYLLTEVTENDLLNFVEVEDGAATTPGITTPVEPQEPEDPGLNEQEPEEEPEPEPEPEQSGMGGTVIIILLVAAAGGAAYYFLKVKKGQSEPLGSLDDLEYEGFDDDEDYPDEGDDIYYIDEEPEQEE